MTAKINQKEYLKKYLSSHVGDKKKKKKKQHKIKNQTVHIIDDDIDISKLRNIDDNDDIELFVTGEDAPQVVGVVDDRPPELIALDFKNSNKWKVLSENDGWDSTIKVQRGGNRDQPSQKSGDRLPEEDNSDLSPVRKKSNRRDSDESPPRRPRKSPTKKNRDSDSDQSPIRKTKRRGSSSDVSPPRRKPRRSLDRGNNRTQRSPARKRYDSDRSPKADSSRRGRADSDLSPPRIKNRDRLGQPSKQRSFSPDGSPQRRHIGQGRRRSASNSDQSPPRKSTQPSRQRKSRFDSSPPRSTAQKSPDLSPPRRNAPDRSPRGRNDSRRNREESTSPPPTHGDRKMTKTLDGKMAGLQNAKALRIENEQFKQKEKQMFDKMSKDVSGQSGKVVMRDRKTGRIRDLEKERQHEAEKQLVIDKRKEIYDRWGKGIKQTEDYRSRLEEHAHEVNKPLARYSDDVDLDEHLKKQERLGDPMLEYLKQKERDKRKQAGFAERPLYKGLFPDNRFNIRPGYRWDGVDRSNGYEQKWFDVQSKKEASKEEIYKYSVEDM